MMKNIFDFSTFEMHFIAFWFCVLSVCACVCCDEYPPNNARVTFDLYPNFPMFETFQFGVDLENSFLINSFDPKIPTHFYMHGFLGDPFTIETYCNELVTVGDFNCVAVDWTIYAHNINYYRVKYELDAVSGQCFYLDFCNYSM